MKHNLTDEQLILRYSRGDLLSFEELYERHKGPLFRFCLRNFKQKPLAEECFQEIWLKIVKNRMKYQPKALFTTYLYRIAQNTLIDFYRKNKKRQNDCEFDEEIASSHIEKNSMLEGSNDLVKEKIMSLREKIIDLPFEQRNTLLLKINSNLSLAEIAEILDCGKETVKSRLRYATNKLKELFDEPFIEKENEIK